MNTSRQTAAIHGAMHPHTNRRAASRSVKERTMKPTAANLIRWAGLSAMMAGILFVVIQPIHPPDVISSVTTARWAIVHSFGVAMCFLGLLGITGLYARQVEEAGWLGLAGFLLFSLWLVLVPGFTFFEAFILPLLAIDAPTFAEGFLGIFTGSASGRVSEPWQRYGR